MGSHIPREERHRGDALPAMRAASADPKRIDDFKPPVEQHPVLQVLGPERLAIGSQRGCGDHGVIGRETVAFGQREAVLVRFDRDR